VGRVGSLRPAGHYLWGGKKALYLQDSVSGYVCCGVGWPEWLTIDLSFNFNIAWICIKQDTFSDFLGALYPGIPIYPEAEVSDLPQVVFVFCSHTTLPKRFSLWTSRELKLVFITALVRQCLRRWRE
jgi:hypothetical protein